MEAAEKAGEERRRRDARVEEEPEEVVNNKTYAELKAEREAAANTLKKTEARAPEEFKAEGKVSEHKKTVIGSHTINTKIIEAEVHTTGNLDNHFGFNTVHDPEDAEESRPFRGGRGGRGRGAPRGGRGRGRGGKKMNLEEADFPALG